MRDLLFKNLTSADRKRKIIASSEVMDKEGVRSVIHRHFVCIAKEISADEIKHVQPAVQVVKEQNTLQKKQRFFCKIKGCIYTNVNNRIFVLSYMHTLNINLIPIPNYC